MEEFEELFDIVFDELYSSYRSEIGIQHLRYGHPMFYNGTFSKDNSYQPPEPDKEMTKEEFRLKLENGTEEDRWNTAFQVLFNYLVKQKEANEN